jgi:hypothetical protein
MLTHKLLGSVTDPNPVVFEGAGAYVEVASTTTLNVAAPTGASVGDLLVCGIMCRSTASAPTGWVAAVQITGASITQRTVIWTKTAVAGDLGVTTGFTQASANRFLGQMLAFSKQGGTPAVAAVNSRLDSNALVATLASVTGEADDQVAVGCGSAVYASTTNVIMSFSSEWTQTSPTSGQLSRLGVAYRSVDEGVVTGGTITINDASQNSWPMVTALLE